MTKKNNEVNESNIDVSRATAMITSPRKIVYPNVNYQYGVQLQTEKTITELHMVIEYDVRTLELVDSQPVEEGITISADLEESTLMLLE